jgi:S-adenosylmethionine/arginine decarboxylase-like enzyme
MENNGLLIASDLSRCADNIQYLNNKNLLQQLISELLVKFNLTEMDSVYVSFGEDCGITGLVVLAESHLAIHTWPERCSLNLDIYLCNFKNDNSDTARKLSQEFSSFFNPAVTLIKTFWRS